MAQPHSRRGALTLRPFGPSGAARAGAGSLALPDKYGGSTGLDPGQAGSEPG